jgi:hypothetical protein
MEMATHGGLGELASSRRKRPEQTLTFRFRKTCVECGEPFDTNFSKKIRCSFDCQEVYRRRVQREKDRRRRERKRVEMTP